MMYNMKTFKTFFSPDKVASFILYFSILTFIIAFNFSDNGVGGWTQQFMPFVNNRPIADIIFLDSITGYAVTGNGIGGKDTNYILKTTNAGDNWNIIYNSINDFRDFTRIIFLNLDTGYVLKGDTILRTINAGESWNSIPVPPDNFGFKDMFAISYDTIWVTTSFIGGDYIYRTTNAGLNWTNQMQGNSFDNLYFFNNRIGFVGNEDIFTNTLLKTTNSGLNWINISGQNGFFNMNFTDSLFGWKCLDSMRHTTNGGLTWMREYIPLGGNITGSSRVYDFSNIGKDTLWAVGGVYRYPNNQYRGILYRTTNRGQNWNYQIPDTSINLLQYLSVTFKNHKLGWSYIIGNSGIHTTTGGDTSFITNIVKPSITSPENYILYQNYPNPFNPSTKIKYELRKSSNVSIIIFDILGKEISSLINKIQTTGKYEKEFDASGLTSGIYFYSLIIDNINVDTKKMILLR